ncbi:Aspartate--tRNA(Asp/Asn) ligase [uncultured archaeon]|nr:Aspartate--tRNA(Asp/Asn) ligase [uncultured archaeon]
MRVYVSEVIPDIADSTVDLAGWVHETRDHGKIRFLILRDKSGVVQCVGKKGVVPDELFEKMSQPKETVISVKGTVKASKQAPGGVEIVPTEIRVLNSVNLLLPVDPTEHLTSELDVRLDNRHIDLRRRKTHSIFHIQSRILRAFREHMTSQDFEEIIPPSIIAGTSEGGADVFPVVYFEREAFLSQSPQLYKQLAVIGGMEKVFMTPQYFRAEKHNTTAHLNEITGMDVEIGFADHHVGMKFLGDTFLHILSRVKRDCPQQLDALGVELEVPKKINTYTYTEAVDMLNKSGMKFEWGGDLGRDEERKLYEIIKEEAYLISEYPTAVRAFYSMPNAENPKISNSYDLMYRGVEMASGAQRVHLPDLLVTQMKAKGMNPDGFKFYIDAFKSGAPPHAGWALGLQRLTMAITKQNNIRECIMFPRDMHRLTP